MSKILVSGGTGFVGKSLVERLGALGHEVTVLSRSAKQLPAGAKSIHAYTPLEPGAWFQHLEGQEVVISLAGERAVGVRYSEENKQRIRESRVQGTRTLVQAIAQTAVKPKLFMSASAIGFYGSEIGSEPRSESSPAGEDFLAQVCVEWERSAAAVEALGVRLVVVRLGVVLGKGGGALEALQKPFRMFVGGEVGSGKQYFSWIHLEDVVRGVEHLLADPEAHGAFNVTGPKPVTNAELTRVMGQTLQRPTWFKAPAFALKLVLGEGAAPIIGGQPVLPKRLSERGFEWKYPDLASALGNLLA